MVMFPYTGRIMRARMRVGKRKRKKEVAHRDWRMSFGLRTDYVERLLSVVGGRYLDFVAQTNESTAHTSLRLDGLYYPQTNFAALNKSNENVLITVNFRSSIN